MHTRDGGINAGRFYWRKLCHCCRFFTFCDSHCNPSNRPSPVVAQLNSKVKFKNNKSIELRTLGEHTTIYRASGADQVSPLLRRVTLLWRNLATKRTEKNNGTSG